jgi:hypothetical protein
MKVVDSSLARFLEALAEPHPWPAGILVDELDVGAVPHYRPNHYGAGSVTR